MFLVGPNVFSFVVKGVSGHHYLPTCQILMISDNVEFLPPIFYACFGRHFENGRHLVNTMKKLKFRTLMLITSKCIMIET
jgi:hypothetical protein